MIEAVQNKEDPSSAVTADADREATVEMHYMKQTEVVLRRRISRLSDLLASDEFMSSMVACFNRQLFDFYRSEGAVLENPEKGVFRYVSEDGKILAGPCKNIHDLTEAYGFMDASFCRNMGQAQVGFVVKTFMQDLLLDPFFSKLEKIVSKEFELLHLHEL